MCDCVEVKEILEYDGNISMVCRWAQELLGYHFTVLHRSKHMMRDVDALTRRFGPLVAQYMMIAAVLNDLDKIARPVAYASTLDPTVNITKVIHNVSPASVPILTCTTIASHMESSSHTSDTIVYSPLSTLSSVPVLLQCSAFINIDAKQTSSPLIYNAADSEVVAQDLCVSWLCINDICGDIHTWATSGDTGPLSWEVHNIFESKHLAKLFTLMYQNITFGVDSRFSSCAWPVMPAWVSTIV